MQDLIECFPDEDEHLKKFCFQKSPRRMPVEELLTMLKCPPPAESERASDRVRERERVTE